MFIRQRPVKSWRGIDSPGKTGQEGRKAIGRDNRCLWCSSKKSGKICRF